MKAYNINCPNCGASVNLEKDVPRCFCPYCGTQIIVDDGVQRSEVVYRDEAKILELQLQEQVRLREEQERLRSVEAEEKRQEALKQKRQKRIKRFIIVTAIFCIICFVMGMLHLKYENTPIVILVVSTLIIPFFFPYDDSTGLLKRAGMYYLLCFPSAMILTVLFGIGYNIVK